MENKISLSPHDLCTGCGACFASCKNGSLSMLQDSNGFFYPSIDALSCINCHCCEISCPVLHQELIDKTPLLAAYAQSSSVKLANYASSGGICSQIALNLFQKGWIVYGVKVSDDLRPYYCAALSIEDINSFSKSKYVQVSSFMIFEEIKKHLNSNKNVVFFGTPCSVDGLKRFLRQEYSNLLTVDFYCHSVPSPKAYSLYLKYLKSRFGNVQNITFKTKKYGYSLPLTDIQTAHSHHFLTSNNDPYLRAFLDGKISRTCCYKCRYRENHFSDITVADAYSYNGTVLDFNRGVNRLFVWSNRALELLYEFQGIIIERKDFSSLFQPSDTKIVQSSHPINFGSLESDSILFFKRNFKISLKNHIVSFCRIILGKLHCESLIKSFLKRIKNGKN